MRTFLHARDENFPNAAPDQFPHWMNPAIPEIEIADHADAPGIGGPDRKIDAALAADLAQVRTEFVVKALVISLCKKMQIHLAHERAIAVGIAQQLLGAVKRDDFHQIGKVARFVRHGRLVEPLDVQPLGRERLRVIIGRHDLDLLRLRSKDADDQIFARAMWAEHPERIGMGSVKERGDLVRVDGVNGK